MTLISLNLNGIPMPAIPQQEIGQVSQPSNISAPVPTAYGTPSAPGSGAELGAIGTPIFGGFLRELGEYNAELSWPSAYLVYEKMRRSDAQVAGTLMALKLPIRCAEWRIQIPPDASPVEKTAAEFVEHCLFDDIDFDAALENALLMLDFGASMHEDVYRIDGGQVKLEKLAARLPLTFYRWLCAPGTDNLVTVEQLGYRAGNYIRTQIPVDKLTLFTFQREGANFTGRSLLRSMYQHWYIKSNLYRIDAIACERNGLGVPAVTMAEDVKREDREAALGWVESLTAHQKTGLVLPAGWQFKLEGVGGQLRDPKDSIQHHNMAITMAGLAQFMTMGQSQHGGNRSLGKTMSDFFYLSLQATANQVARAISLTTVKRLVDFNFAGVKNYPKLVPQQILSVDFESVVQALQALASATVDAVRPDDELEAWIRQKIGAPKAGEPRLRVAAPTPAPGIEGNDGGGNAGGLADDGAEDVEDQVRSKK
jgi:phage gp29-like protein